mmetsp:Transcript_16734/g.25287  ORF Transcript_16734/g.25287 Transcript_16734/m.25287 type:complete len:115 (-) Transcript_16734:25-369(-)
MVCLVPSKYDTDEQGRCAVQGNVRQTGTLSIRLLGVIRQDAKDDTYVEKAQGYHATHDDFGTGTRSRRCREHKTADIEEEHADAANQMHQGEHVQLPWARGGEVDDSRHYFTIN